MSISAGRRGRPGAAAGTIHPSHFMLVYRRIESQGSVFGNREIGEVEGKVSADIIGDAHRLALRFVGGGVKLLRHQSGFTHEEQHGRRTRRNDRLEITAYDW